MQQCWELRPPERWGLQQAIRSLSIIDESVKGQMWLPLALLFSFILSATVQHSEKVLKTPASQSWTFQASRTVSQSISVHYELITQSMEFCYNSVKQTRIAAQVCVISKPFLFIIMFTDQCHGENLHWNQANSFSTEFWAPLGKPQHTVISLLLKTKFPAHCHPYNVHDAR